MTDVTLIHAVKPPTGTGRMRIRNVRGEGCGHYAHGVWEFLEGLPTVPFYMIPDPQDQLPYAPLSHKAILLRQVAGDECFKEARDATRAYDVYVVLPQDEGVLLLGVLFYLPMKGSRASRFVWGGYEGWSPSTAVRLGTTHLAFIPRQSDGTGRFNGQFTGCVVEELRRI